MRGRHTGEARRTGLRARAAAAAALIALGGFGAAAAQIPTPRPKPERAFASPVLPDADFRRVADGLAAAERGDWARVRSLESAAADPLAQKILRWRRLASDPRATFGELDAAVDEFATWPRAATIRSEAEAKISETGLSPAAVVAWFELHPPQSGAGKIALAGALFAAGRAEEGEATLKDAWRNNILSSSDQAAALVRFGDRLTREDHHARIDMLLWRGQRGAASNLFSVASSGYRAVANARAELAGRTRNANSAYNAVPEGYRDDPGLLYERARWLRRADREEEAARLLAQITGPAPTQAAADAMWRERRNQVGRLRREGDVATAYELAKNHGAAEGLTRTDGEWLAGWIALRHTGDLDAAAAHFAEVEANATTPISISRGAYWRGRAAEARGQAADAEGHYTRAARYVTAYYGQLAAARLGPAARAVQLPTDARPDPAERAAFDDLELVRVLKIMTELDEGSLFDLFAFALDDALEAPEHYALLAELADAAGRAKVGVRGGKSGLARGVIEPSAAFPVPPLPPLPANAPEQALILALMRQESEFYEDAVSSAGARGLMQLMPATAQQVSRWIGESYERDRLTADPDYNIRLGSAYLGQRLQDFGGSYIMAAAAYNAGAHRVSQWVEEYGDPRRDDVDAIDWVESIPFEETRNYVMRVLENTTIYRARLNGGAVTIRLDADLERGVPPA